ncbi:aldo/keto reductase [Deinococcus budaensis]|uniref:Aryl-alcohol dehydrogenase-like predicted oxidoreductase n=1 Tax=Deinococcus budaensis TaxID=1665626 RepID=A0A7W8GDQ7_9DEIO|nr:aldo/keto reductase [Deinococcus budaensis]MBB5233710.1 aryl-alcohol dehydrogenase-like predicted oxidoreductase [Deinococcus budaensis]
MDYVRLGTSGLKVSRIALGTMTYGDPGWRDWVLPEAQGRPFIARALELGINFFDTADMYSLGASEEVLGRALRDYARRDEVVVATKVFHRMGPGPNDAGLSRGHIMSAVQASLKRLGTDYIDLYQIHRFDPETPILETMTALHDLVRMGAVRYIGASSMLAYQFAKMQHVADMHGLTRFVSMQNHYNLVYREEEREMLPLCREDGVGVIPWSPLARGFLAGNRTPGEARTPRARSDRFSEALYRTPDDYAVQTRVAEVAGRRGMTPAQVATAWLLHQPGVTAPIVGASKMPHLEEAVAALAVKLTPEDLSALEELYRPHPVLGL